MALHNFYDTAEASCFMYGKMCLSLLFWNCLVFHVKTCLFFYDAQMEDEEEEEEGGGGGVQVAKQKLLLIFIKSNETFEALKIRQS